MTGRTQSMTSPFSLQSLQIAGVGVRATLEGATEQSLVERVARDGDGQAFAELVRRHQGKVRGLLLRLTGQRELADDLAQETFLRAYRGLGAFEGRARVSTWLYRIAYNVFVNHRQRSKVLDALPEDFDPAAPVTPATNPTHGDLRRDVHAAVATLPEHYRAVVVLHYLEDASYPEIAEILDLPLGTVKTHLHRAKKLLRGQLQGWGDETTDASVEARGEDVMGGHHA